MSRHNDLPATGFGAGLRVIRNEKNVTQAVLAVRAGVTPSTVYRLEAEGIEPALPVALALARVLGVGLDDVVRAGEAAARGPQVEAAPARRGRPPKAKPAEPEPAQPKRPRGRPKKGSA